MAVQVHVINNITKEYPDMYKVVLFKKPAVYARDDATVKRNKLEVPENYSPKDSSLHRTKQNIKDIVLCNDFELFCTFTFDPKKVDSFNLDLAWSTLSRWLSHQRERADLAGKKLKYLIIPEQHKSGRWHFHGLISGYSSTLKPSKMMTTSLRPIYNITSFRSGFTTAVLIDDKEAVANYVTKYITKDLVKTFNQRRFFCSRNLIRPKREVNSSVFHKTLPLFRRKISDYDDKEVYLIHKVPS